MELVEAFAFSGWTENQAIYIKGLDITPWGWDFWWIKDCDAIR
ncbi:MAG: hypothetical protein RR054_05330 [Clostridia bacterium]